MQESVLTMGFTDVDHFHPGSNVALPIVASPRFVRSIFPLSNFLVSSGLDILFLCISTIVIRRMAIVSKIDCESYYLDLILEFALRTRGLWSLEEKRKH